eukprot:1232682-Pyramimonas_sp.AAC.1
MRQRTHPHLSLLACSAPPVFQAALPTRCIYAARRAGMLVAARSRRDPGCKHQTPAIDKRG